MRVQHGHGDVMLSKPFIGFEAHESVNRCDDDAPQCAVSLRVAAFASVPADAVTDDQLTMLHTNLGTVAVNDHNMRVRTRPSEDVRQDGSRRAGIGGGVIRHAHGNVTRSGFLAYTLV